MKTASTTKINAGLWIRVSTGGQDEQNQVPDIERYCDTHDYHIAKRYELHDKSASKGEQQSNIDEMLDDMREGTIQVLVCWHSNRLERRGPEFVFPMLAKVRDTHGRIESVQEPMYGQKDFASQISTATNAVIDWQKSQLISKQVRAAHGRIRTAGAVGPGGAPWGFTIEGPKYGKQLVPTKLCVNYVPKIYDRCIAGQTCREIAEWLDAEGAPPKRGARWHEGSVRKLIRNRVYAGRWQNEAKTQTLVRITPVVPADVWDKAQQALRQHSHHAPMDEANRPTLGNLKCARCMHKDGTDSPMYRIRLNSRSGKPYYYYRCTGRGAQRHGCGNMVPLILAEDTVYTLIAMFTNEPHQIREWVEGTGLDTEISDIIQDMQEAFNTRNFEKFHELEATLADLEKRNEEAVKGHWEYEDTGLTVGAYFMSLDDAGKREYLKTRDIRIGNAPKRDGVPGVRVVIDGEDYGVICMTKASS